MPKAALVVEDDEHGRRTLVRSFTLSCYSAVGVGTLKEAQQYIDSGNYDVCLSDGCFPNEPGREEVKGNGIILQEYVKTKSPHTRFILFTGHRPTLEEAKRKGIEAYNKSGDTTFLDLINQ